MNANKTEYMCFKQKKAISTISGKPLKLEDHFTHFSSILSSTESDVNIQFVNVWNAVVRLSITRKSNLSGKMKPDFFQN